MNHFNYPIRLKQIWDDAIATYQAGNRAPDTYFDKSTLADLASIGLNAMDVYDPVEDFLDGEEIDFNTFLLISAARRDYFFSVQKGQLSAKVLDSSTLPAKDSEARGIIWLPRIIQKAHAKLRGELSAESMYSCGGDRRFLKTNNIHASEFLRVVWAYEDEPDKLIDWVEARSATSNT